MNTLKQNYINHIAIVLDASGSMQGLRDQVIKVFDTQIKNLANRSKELKQETRISVYTFHDHNVECLAYDLDVLRLPSIASEYKPDGGTPLIDATIKSIEDLEKTATLYGDHAFLVIALTDGQENTSINRPTTLASKIQGLPDNWTLGCFVPDAFGVSEAKKFGFSANNVQQWSADGAGLKEVGETISKITTAYMTARATGVRGTRSLFSVDTSNLNTSTIKSVLTEIKPKDYSLLPVSKEAVIKPFVEAWKIDYVPGSAYYELTKPETIQAYKQIAVQDKKNGKIYSGSNARNLLGLPNSEIRIAPADHQNHRLFIQSTSINRKLVSGTQLLVLK